MEVEQKSLREQRAAEALGVQHHEEGLQFEWTSALEVRRVGTENVVKVSAVDDPDLHGYVVFDIDGNVIVAFFPPDGEGE